MSHEVIDAGGFKWQGPNGAFPVGLEGGPVLGLPPLPRQAAPAVWYDGGGQATMGCADFDALDEYGEPPPGPDVEECEECGKRTFKGWVCKFCGARLSLPALAASRY